MIRHSLNYFLGQLKRERPLRFDSLKYFLGELKKQPSQFDEDIIDKADRYLNGQDFYHRLRIVFFTFLATKKFKDLKKSYKKK